MQKSLLPFILTLLSYSGWANGLCTLEKGTTASCGELDDVKYIETYHLESLKAPLQNSVLRPGFFVNLTSLRHLDLSGGIIQQIQPGSFDKLTNLRSLSLAENRIEDLELCSLNGLNHLHSLDLRKNNLQQLPPALAQLKTLKHLDVHGNPLLCDCATLKTRDLIAKRGVKMSKKIVCAGPRNLKGTSLFKKDAATVCQLEEQDREMQNDQAYKGSEEEYGSGDSLEKDEGSGEHADVASSFLEASKEVEVETPYPETEVSTAPSIVETKSTESLRVSTIGDEQTIAPTESMDPVKMTTNKDEEIFFDSGEKKGPTTVAPSLGRKVYKDALFYPVEDFSDEGSGEGSGTGIGEMEKPIEKDEDSSSSSGLLDLLFNAFWSTVESPTAKGDPDLEEEQFIDVSSATEVEEETIASVSETTETAIKASTVIPGDGVELVDNKLHDTKKLDEVKLDGNNVNDELTGASSTKQSKKGMGSYVVLAALLAILATLIGFAAYKGDFCKKKRKRGDVENGTELKDMQKALLETANSTQPKVASNGNVENAPLVVDATDHEEIKACNDCQVTADVPRSPNGISDRAEKAKPPRAVTPRNDQRAKETTVPDGNSLKDDSLSARTGSMDPDVNNSPIGRPPDVNGPPLSPGAQRVKITLQENPDSVPRTPILITRTMAGENLVKTP